MQPLCDKYINILVQIFKLCTKVEWLEFKIVNSLSERGHSSPTLQSANPMQHMDYKPI